MKLCIPIEVRPEGGMYTFVALFRHWLEQHGLPFTDQIDDQFDILFVNSWVVPYAAIRRARRAQPHARVVQRVDGAAVDYGSSAANDRRQARVNLLADLTIFQSEYSRFSTMTKFPVISRDGPVIYNPVDINRFAPLAPGRAAGPRPRVACAAWSVNRGKGTWQLKALAAEHGEVDFVLCGRFDREVTAPNITRLGHLDRAGMAAALQSCDVFLNLSLNDPCPNVVLEAMASGLPVIYLRSGGVPELVGSCGVGIDRLDAFGPALTTVMATRGALAAAARERTEAQFSPDVIFPQYVAAIRSAMRTPATSTWATLSLAQRGYPVLPADSVATLTTALARRMPSLARVLRRGKPARQVGWVTYDAFPNRKRRLSQLDSFTNMRVGNIARWLNAGARSFRHELYDADRRYDIVVFQKMMNAACQTEAEKIRAYGGKVVFDANVNYYEVWGDYFVPGTEPTTEQQRDAIWMTRFADHVVADSSYLAKVVRQFNAHVTWIPDNVNLDVYRGPIDHVPHRGLRAVWSGVGKKAAHLRHLVDVLAAVKGLELVLVVDEPPAWLAELQRVVPCRVVTFSDSRYAKTLRECDVIISPKRLVNAYEMGHTEYKITLGMAVGLPAVASPQPSYVEAVTHAGGGIIADDADAWHRALSTLADDPTLRHDLGQRAHRTVVECYSTPVVAARYEAVLAELLGIESHAPAQAT